MKAESQLLKNFTESRHSRLLDSYLVDIDLSVCPIIRLCDELEAINVQDIYRIKNFTALDNVVDAHFVTSHGTYSLRFIESKTKDTFTVMVVNLDDYTTLNTFTLSKQQPSGLPDGA